MFAAALFASAPAFADKASVRVLSSSELSMERMRRLAVAAEVALKEFSGFQVEESGNAAVVAPPAGAKKNCIEKESCVLAVAKEASTPEVLVLYARVSGGQLTVDAQLVDVPRQKAVRKTVEEGSANEPEAAAKPLVEQILPPWARKGWGGLLVMDDSDVVKVDGQTLGDQARVDPLPLPAGRHEVDVLLPNGSAVLQRLEIGEGSRAEISRDALPTADLVEPGQAIVGTGRYVGYGAWTAGVLCIAGSLISGALAKDTLKDVRTCSGADRSCTNFQDAESARLRSESYAKTGNVLLGVGAGLALVGAGLVTFDLASK